MEFNLKTEGCACGKQHLFNSRIIIGENAINKLPEILEALNCKKPFILADRNTYEAAGHYVFDLLHKNGIKAEKYIFSKAILEPDEANVGLAAMNFSPECDAVIGVGSGVINDISKIIANIADKSYIIVGTAPSMDGYASATSSMTMEGLKISLNSKCADVIIGDTNILCKAPVEMMISGLGDMLAKYVSICEWRISNIINGEYYCEDIASLVRASLKKCVDNAEGLVNKEKNAVEAVFEGLILCGAEFGTPVEFHGIQCALGTLISIKLYEKIKNITPERKKAFDYVEKFDFHAWSKTLREFLGKGAESMIALEEKEQKYDIESHKRRFEIIAEKWDNILSIISEELPSTEELQSLYTKVGLPKTMAEIGLDEEILPLTFKASKDIRDKYVLSRLCWDLGIIDDII